MGNPRLFANLKRPGDEIDGGAVFLTIGPTGDLVYADYDRGEIRRIHYYGANVPPVASFTATPSFGPAPLTVAFDASGSTDANHDTLSYAWDLDGDGAYDDGTGVTESRTYTAAGNVTVGLRVTDPMGAAGTATQTVAVANTPPTVDITEPVRVAGVGRRRHDLVRRAPGLMPRMDHCLASAYAWTLTMRHCPADCHSHIIETFTGREDRVVHCARSRIPVAPAAVGRRHGHRRPAGPGRGRALPEHRFGRRRDVAGRASPSRSARRPERRRRR